MGFFIGLWLAGLLESGDEEKASFAKWLIVFFVVLLIILGFILWKLGG